MTKRSAYGGKDAVPAGSSGGFLPRRGPSASYYYGEPVVWHTAASDRADEGTQPDPDEVALEFERGNWRKHNLRQGS